MTVDRTLLDVLVCPACKGPLVEVHGPLDGAIARVVDGAAAPVGDGAAPAAGSQPLAGLDCRPCRLRYPVIDDIPVMLVDQARRISA